MKYLDVVLVLLEANAKKRIWDLFLFFFFRWSQETPVGCEEVRLERKNAVPNTWLSGCHFGKVGFMCPGNSWIQWKTHNSEFPHQEARELGYLYTSFHQSLVGGCSKGYQSPGTSSLPSCRYSSAHDQRNPQVKAYRSWWLEVEPVCPRELRVRGGESGTCRHC